MAGAPAPPAFRAERYDLEGSGLWLSAVTPDDAALLGNALAEIDPWARYGTSAGNMAAMLVPTADGGIRLAVRRAGQTAPVGVLVIRHPWLIGPYMQLLALVPAAQGQGYGAALLQWFETQALQGGARSLWICVSAFNAAAQRLYRRFGFETVVILDDLVNPEIDEILMRKRLTVSGN
jgi:diamine N-acetyltransferase